VSDGSDVRHFFEGTPYSRRDLLVARDAAFGAVEWVFREMRCVGDRRIEHVDGRSYAETTYPLPRVTRPRVVRDDGWPIVDWQSDGLNLYWRYDGGLWVRYPQGVIERGPWPTKERVALWADLIANPTETVEADD